MESAGRRLERLGLTVSLPPTVLLVRTNGNEEGGNAYTREHAIILACPDVPFPGELLPLKMTNPDAFHRDSCIDVEVAGAARTVTPVLYAGGAYTEGGLFDSRVFRLMAAGSRRCAHKEPTPDIRAVPDTCDGRRCSSDPETLDWSGRGTSHAARAAT